MISRRYAALIFAAFGALTVYAFVAWHDVGYLLNLLVAKTAFFAAISAGLLGATFARSYADTPIVMGIMTMLLAHIPFSTLMLLNEFQITKLLTISMADLLSTLFAAIIFGWYFAGLFQIVAGALAGIVIEQWFIRTPHV